MTVQRGGLVCVCMDGWPDMVLSLAFGAAATLHAQEKTLREARRSVRCGS